MHSWSNSVELVLGACAVLQGMKNPLDNVSQLRARATPKPEDKAQKTATGMYQYFLKVWGCIRGAGVAAEYLSAGVGHCRFMLARDTVLCCHVGSHWMKRVPLPMHSASRTFFCCMGA